VDVAVAVGSHGGKVAGGSTVADGRTVGATAVAVGGGV
jgi:hypothetical protein